MPEPPSKTVLVVTHGMTVDRVTVRQRKIGHPVRFELSEQTREAVDNYIRSAPRRAGELLFPSRRHTDRCLTTRQYSRYGGGYRAYAPALAALKEVKAPPVASLGRPFDIWRDRASDKAWTVGRVERPGVLIVVWRTNNKRDARRLMDYPNSEWETNGPLAIVNKGKL